jgi:hypothetical protein
VGAWAESITMPAPQRREKIKRFIEVNRGWKMKNNNHIAHVEACKLNWADSILVSN